MAANLGFRFAPPQALRYRRAPRAKQTDDELDQSFLQSVNGVTLQLSQTLSFTHAQNLIRLTPKDRFFLICVSPHRRMALPALRLRFNLNGVACGESKLPLGHRTTFQGVGPGLSRPCQPVAGSRDSHALEFC